MSCLELILRRSRTTRLWSIQTSAVTIGANALLVRDPTIFMKVESWFFGMEDVESRRNVTGREPEGVLWLHFSELHAMSSEDNFLLGWKLTIRSEEENLSSRYVPEFLFMKSSGPRRADTLRNMS